MHAEQRNEMCLQMPTKNAYKIHIIQLFVTTESTVLENVRLFKVVLLQLPLPSSACSCISDPALQSLPVFFS